MAIKKVANNWPANFFNGEISKRSSFSPRKNIINADAIKYWIQGALVNGIKIQLEKIRPAKIAIPPNDEIGFLWILRSQGISYNFFASEILIMTGMEVYAMKNEVSVIIKIESIAFFCLIGADPITLIGY